MKEVNNQKANERPKQNPTRQAITVEYEEFQRRYLNLGEGTLANYKRHLNCFFDWLDLEHSPKGISEIDFKTLQGFVLYYGESHGLGAQRNMHCSLRSFLKFCHQVGHLNMDLCASIPPVRKVELAAVPFILDDKSLKDLFDSIDQTTLAGKRDYAILKLLETYGIRSIQVRRLKLEDILWKQSRILIQSAKGGTAVEHPLMAQAGNALLDYLQNGRPLGTGYQEVFLTICAPYRPLSIASNLTSIVIHRLDRAGIQLPKYARKGTHLFRHLFASRMLSSGTPLTHIADMLGHRNLRSTMVYTKIDFKDLTCVAQDWPAEDLKGINS